MDDPGNTQQHDPNVDTHEQHTTIEELRKGVDFHEEEDEKDEGKEYMGKSPFGRNEP